MVEHFPEPTYRDNPQRCNWSTITTAEDIPDKVHQQTSWTQDVVICPCAYVPQKHCHVSYMLKENEARRIFSENGQQKEHKSTFCSTTEMAPSIFQEDGHSNGDSIHTEKSYPQPLRKHGALDQAFRFEEITPAIGREYPSVNIVDDLLNGSNSDELLRDLAITISERGVVFFRAQNNLTNNLQKTFIQKLGELSGKPKASTVHIHPILNNSSEFGVGDHEISTISSLQRKKVFEKDKPAKRRYDAAQWHSDIQFEPYPADYTSLRLTQLPSTGGDTLWASGYDIYEAFSPAYQKFFDGLTATFVGDGFLKAEQEGRAQIYKDPRGNPNNIGGELSTIHPVVRTNPVTGWKSIYALGAFPKVINELNEEEGAELIKKFTNVILENHDIQVRFKWRNENDIAIWDNRSVFHSATFDYDGLGERFGNRVVGIGERPYLDPESKTKSQELRERKAE